MTILKGILSLILYSLNLLVHALIILICAPFVFIMPSKWRKAFQQHFLFHLPMTWTMVNTWIMAISTKNHWDVLGTGALQLDNWYMVISNHVSWIDILVLSKVFHRKIPPLKFFMKKELLWQLPFAGIACYALGYPFMSRHSHEQIKKNPALKGKDAEATKKACEKVKEFPTALINFAEGTRFTQKKRERQESPFQHLLKPRAGGVAIVLQELNQQLSGIVNVVITYSPKVPSFWDFACGKFDRIKVRYELMPITSDLIGDYNNDRQFRSHIQQWFNTLWERNDALIERLSHEK